MSAQPSKQQPGKQQAYSKLNVRLPDAFAKEDVRVVLAYEAAKSGKQLSQALIDLVLEEADVESYPADVRERIAELEEAIRRDAADHALGE